MTCRMLEVVSVISVLSCGLASGQGLRSVTEESHIVVIPQPKKIQWLEENFTVSPKTRIVVGGEAEEEDRYAAREINEFLTTHFGFALPLVSASEAGGEAKDVIVLGEPWLNPLAKRLLSMRHVDVTSEDPGPDGYVLNVWADCIIIAGSDRRGTFYGVQTFKQLLVPPRAEEGRQEDSREGKPVMVKGVQIKDWPGHAFRGILFHPDDYSKTYHVAMIDKVLSKYKFNHIIIEAEYVRWDSQPEIQMDWAASKEDIRTIIKAAEEHLIDVSPLIQTLGHCEWLFHNGQNRDIVEDATTPYAYNPLHPRTYEVVLGVMDEAIELFEPEFVHIGHDEVDMRGRFPNSPEGKKLGLNELFIRDVNRLHQHITKRECRVMMWHDELQDEMLSRIPKDITIAAWDYSPEISTAREDQIKRFLDGGLGVIGATWYRPANIRNFSRLVKSVGGRGMLQTTWAGYHGTRTQIQKELRQVTAYILAGEYFWNPLSDRSPRDLPYDVEKQFHSDWNPLPKARPKAGIESRVDGNSHLFSPSDKWGRQIDKWAQPLVLSVERCTNG